MGCVNSRPGPRMDNGDGSELPMNTRASELDSRLARTHRERRVTRILLLGAGESGKSTVLKQMRLIHGMTFTDQERAHYTAIIWSDTVQSMRIILEQAEQLGVSLGPTTLGSEIASYRNLVMSTTPDTIYMEDEDNDREFMKEYVVDMHHTGTHNVDPDENDELLANAAIPKISKREVAAAIDALWKSDVVVKTTMQHAHRFQLEVNASYYFDNVHNYATPGYLASDTDILVGRIKTMGITQTTFNIKGTCLMLIDVGGQRSERKKWIHCFDNVTAVLFVAAISEFDEVLYEDGQTNRVAESLALFGQIINSRWFRSTPIILFLNKIDILKRKIVSGKSLTEYYPEFKGDPGNLSDVLAFMKNRFLIENLSSSRQIYVHETCATDTKSMEYVMAAVTDMVFEKNLIWSGLL